jgi:hypothetical protein
MRPLGPNCGQFFPLELDDLPCFDNPPFRFSDLAFKLGPGDLSFRQFPTLRLKICPQFSHHPLRISHRCL